jgi:hypothetical protein
MSHATTCESMARAARVFATKEPKFAAEIGLLALGRLLEGSGYDPGISLIQEAFGHLMGAASRIGAQDWAGICVCCLCHFLYICRDGGS